MEMSTEIQSINNILISKEYRDLLIHVCRNLEVEFDDDIPEILLEDDIDKLKASQVSSSEIQNAIRNSIASLAQFSITKFRELQGKIYNDGEFPPDEPQGENEKSTVLEKHPMYANFLISYIIEFILASQYPEKVEQFLKVMRYPHAKKYAKQLKMWANE